MNLFSKKTKVLIVEDEKDIAESIQARLSLEGYETILAANGQQGVELARSEKPQLMIVDVMMPLLNGYDVCNLIKHDPRTQKIPILVLTALPHVDDAEKAFAAGADDFLNKPYTNDRLMQKINKLLGK